jgi:hypothetical protein
MPSMRTDSYSLLASLASLMLSSSNRPSYACLGELLSPSFAKAGARRASLNHSSSCQTRVGEGRIAYMQSPCTPVLASVIFGSLLMYYPSI